MIICEGMLVKDVLFDLNKQFQVGHIGRTKKWVRTVPPKLIQKGNDKKKCLKVKENTKFSTIALICSASAKNPIKFVNETVGILAPTWSVREYLHQSEKRSIIEPSDKKSLVLKLIATAELFSDIDWVLRVIRNSKISAEKDFIEQLQTAIFNSSLPFDKTQRLTLHSMLTKELIFNEKSD